MLPGADKLKVGTQDTFGRSGNADRPLEMYGISTGAIVKKAKEALELK